MSQEEKPIDTQALKAALAEAESSLGKESYVGEWVVVDQHRINQFADATGDHQWIHIDPARAEKESPYKATIAHGFLTLSMLPALTREVSEGAPAFPGVKLSVNYGLNRVRFPAPVPGGSRIRARVTPQSVREVPGGFEIIREVTIDLEGGEKPCCAAETITRHYF